MGYLFLLFIPLFWLLIIRPQQQQRRAHMQVVATLQPGQRVMTVGGLIGTLTEVGDETVSLDVGDGTELTYGRTFIRQRIDDVDDAAGADETEALDEDDPTGQDAPAPDEPGDDVHAHDPEAEA